jgi:hypothetical protein
VIGGKKKIELVERLIGYPQKKIQKRIVGENRCDDISFRPLSGDCQKRKRGR